MAVAVEKLITSDILKPGHYLGNQRLAVHKSWDMTAIRWVLTYPEVDEIGASNLGHIIPYNILNAQPRQLCDRAYLPGQDLAAKLRETNTPLFTVESKRSLREFDILGFSLSYELGATNILEMLDLAGILLGKVVRRAWELGAGMDSWYENLDQAFSAWGSAIAQASLDWKYRLVENGEWNLFYVQEQKRSADAENNQLLTPNSSLSTPNSLDIPLPWDHSQLLETAEYLVTVAALAEATPLQWQDWIDTIKAKEELWYENTTKSGKSQLINLRDRLFELELVETSKSMAESISVIRYVGSYRQEGFLLRPEQILFMLRIVASVEFQMLHIHRNRLILGV